MSFEKLHNQLNTKSKDIAVLLRIDESTPFYSFVSVIDLLNINDLDNVSVLTEKISINAHSLSDDVEFSQ